MSSGMDHTAASIRKSASSSSCQPSQTFCDTISTLKTVCKKPSEMDSIAISVDAASFESLARETRSIAAQRSTSVCKGASLMGRCSLPSLNKQCLRQSLGFSLKPARSSFSSSAATTSAWSNSYKQAIGIRLSGCKGQDW